MSTENSKFKKLMRSFKSELQRNLIGSILPLDEEQIREYEALLREISEPIQEVRIKPLLQKFMSIIEMNQGQLDTQIEDDDYGMAAAMEREWDRLDVIAARIDRFLDSLPPSTPPVKKTA
jgi:hypothetical protein